MPDAVHIIMMGGTIDSIWDREQDAIALSEHSVLPEYFKDIKLYDQITFSEVCMRDSRAITQEDLKAAAKIIEDTSETKILVTHGVYTMPDTAKYLKSHLKRKDQTIILTGAVTPLKGFDMSDAPFNLGYAFSKLQDLAPGVYLAMNGKVFSAEEAAKSISEGKFYSVFSEKQ